MHHHFVTLTCRFFWFSSTYDDFDVHDTMFPTKDLCFYFRKMERSMPVIFGAVLVTKMPARIFGKVTAARNFG